MISILILGTDKIANSMHFTEVQYFFRLKIKASDDLERTVAMVSMFLPPDQALIKVSSGTLYVARYSGNEAHSVIDAKSITSVVAMPPLPLKQEELNMPGMDDKYENLFYVGELIGQDIMHYAGVDEHMEDDEDE